MKQLRISRPPLALACALLLRAAAAGEVAGTAKNETAADVFRPAAGQFPPLEKAYAYRGELVFVDHANRRGSLRVQGAGGTYFRNPPHPFALLPYAVVRYHGAPADLRDIPLGTVLHAWGFLPPDPKTSAVPVLPVDHKDKLAGYSGTGVAPAENHLLLLEDEPSRCLREGTVWKLQEISFEASESLIAAIREPKTGGDGKAAVEKLTFDRATRLWRGRERLSVADLIAEGAWPASGRKALGGQPVLLGITWKPTPDGVFTRFHISDIWLDESAAQRAAEIQTEAHRAFIRSRWMPAWIDGVEYGKFGRATVTATLFGGMDPSLYADFQPGGQVMVNGAENTLKHAGGAYGPAHMASRGAILQVTQLPGKPPLGSSGIQIQFETDLVIEGIRKARVVRIRAAGWPHVQVPREEYVGDGSDPADRFPTSAIFPKY